MVNVVVANPGTPGVRPEYTLDRTPIYHDTYACTHTLYCVADQCTSMFLGRWEEMSLYIIGFQPVSWSTPKIYISCYNTQILIQKECRICVLQLAPGPPRIWQRWNGHDWKCLINSKNKTCKWIKHLNKLNAQNVAALLLIRFKVL